MGAKEAENNRVIARNRKARHDYQIEESIEVGLVLTGSEVKSLRQGRASLADAYAAESQGELVLFNAHIQEYAAANRDNHQPRRTRKLLLHRREMDRLLGAVSRKGMTLVPLDLHFNRRGIAKLQLGLAQGKRKTDKRAAEREREWKRAQGRLLKNRVE